MNYDASTPTHSKECLKHWVAYDGCSCMNLVKPLPSTIPLSYPPRIRQTTGDNGGIFRQAETIPFQADTIKTGQTQTTGFCRLCQPEPRWNFCASCGFRLHEESWNHCPQCGTERLWICGGSFTLPPIWNPPPRLRSFDIPINGQNRDDLHYETQNGIDAVLKLAAHDHAGRAEPLSDDWFREQNRLPEPTAGEIAIGPI
jgi:predicted RNA-binding Zn-ribbon protein involved in translation (DUF1610 family)